MNRILIGIAGIIVILAIACALSTNRRAIRPRVVGAAFALQAAIAVLVLKAPWGVLGAVPCSATAPLWSVVMISAALPREVRARARENRSAPRRE